ncbi:MAG: 50S ribosomal protein L35 [Candidatus Omnitrophica bacterium]|nr:50S ribosomal protein L35 [Candidatus Omnitrophota bacterium]
MIKSKTKKAASSRFKKAKSGIVSRSKPGAGHLMTGKNAKRKRSLRKGETINKADEKRIGRLI